MSSKHAQQDIPSLSPLIPDLSMHNSHNSLWPAFHKTYHFSLVRELKKTSIHPHPIHLCPDQFWLYAAEIILVYKEKTVKWKKLIYTRKVQAVPQLLQKLAVSATQVPVTSFCGGRPINECIHVPLFLSLKKLVQYDFAQLSKVTPFNAHVWQGITPLHHYWNIICI
jgi:hypothetical protein